MTDVFDEVEASRTLSKAQRAEGLMGDPALMEAFDNLKEVYYEAWLKSPPDDVKGRERIYEAAGLIDKLKNQLESMINNGAVSRAQLESIRQRAQR